MMLNVGVLLLCLVVILLFKNIAGDRAAGFMDAFAPEGSGQAADYSAEDRAAGVASELVGQAADAAYEATRSAP